MIDGKAPLAFVCASGSEDGAVIADFCTVNLNKHKTTYAANLGRHQVLFCIIKSSD